MADWLIQKFIPNIPNSQDPGWQDVAIVRDLTAEEAEAAAKQSGATGRLRAVRWDTTEEFDSNPGPPVVAKVTKAET